MKSGVTFKKKKDEGLRQIGILTALPFVMLAGPLVGYFIGHWLDGKLKTEPYLMIILVLLGFISSGKEAYRLIKQATDSGNDDDDEFRV